jgi:transcription-repair coupling factor (superfamily II helicase)
MDRWELSYGDLPSEALNLGWLSEIRLLCFLFGVEKVLWKKSHIHLILHSNSSITETMMVKLQNDHTERFTIVLQDIRSILVQFTEEEALHPFSFLHWIFEQLRSYS